MMSDAEVRGVFKFYNDLRSTPGKRHRVQLCRGESCAAVGALALPDPLPADVTVDNVYCLGNCALALSATIDGEVVARQAAGRTCRSFRGRRRPSAVTPVRACRSAGRTPRCRRGRA
jgi:formate dehydrogenase subunit gamma